jgi:hypothetical protein
MQAHFGLRAGECAEGFFARAGVGVVACGGDGDHEGLGPWLLCGMGGKRGEQHENQRSARGASVPGNEVSLQEKFLSFRGSEDCI